MPMFEPTVEQRRTVRTMAGFGVPQDDIATYVDVDPKTLRKHFREELDRGSIEATAKVAQSLFNMATAGGNVAAAIFWMKARAGWREKQEVTVKTQSLEHLSNEELDAKIDEFVDIRIAERASAGRPLAGIDGQKALPSSTRVVQHRPTTVDRW